VNSKRKTDESFSRLACVHLLGIRKGIGVIWGQGHRDKETEAERGERGKDLDVDVDMADDNINVSTQ